MKKTTYLFAGILILAFHFNTLAQDLLRPTSATTTFTGAAGTMLVNTYNGSGLTDPSSLTTDHAATDPSNSFITSTITGSIDFDLGGTFDVTGLSFWNQNAGGPSTDTGVNGVVFSSSLDGVNYTPIPGAPTTIAEVLTGVSAPEQFTFTSVSAAFIRLEVQSNHGDPSESGFAEIAFSTSGPTLGREANVISQFNVYPNPATTVVTINSSVAKGQIEIFNITGKRVLFKNLTLGSNSLNVSSLVSGVYLARISANGKIETKKLIIK